MSTVIVTLGFILLAAIGAVGRGWFTAAMPDRRSAALATLVLNVGGAFALGAVIANAGSAVITAVGTAGLGALTTFSTMQLDLVELAETEAVNGTDGTDEADGRLIGPVPPRLLAAGYLLGTVVLGVVAADAGLRLEV